MSPFKKNFNFSINSFSTTEMTKHKTKKNPEGMTIRKRENKKMKKIWGSQENGGEERAKSLCTSFNGHQVPL